MFTIAATLILSLNFVFPEAVKVPIAVAPTIPVTVVPVAWVLPNTRSASAAFPASIVPVIVIPAADPVVTSDVVDPAPLFTSSKAILPIIFCEVVSDEASLAVLPESTITLPVITPWATILPPFVALPKLIVSIVIAPLKVFTLDASLSAELRTLRIEVAPLDSVKAPPIVKSSVVRIFTVPVCTVEVAL